MDCFLLKHTTDKFTLKTIQRYHMIIKSKHYKITRKTILSHGLSFLTKIKGFVLI